MNQRAYNNHPQLRCFVGFFGLNRSLRWTYESIRANVLDTLADFGCDVISAAHLNCPETITNVKAGENEIPLDNSGLEKLNLSLSWLEPQRDDNIAAYLPLVLGTPLKFGLYGEDDPDGSTRKNILHQLHSLRQLGRLLELLDPQSFDFFVLLRPDLLYVDPVPVADIVRHIRDENLDLITARWHQCSGLNDRFAFCSGRGAYAYLNRLKWLRQLCNVTGTVHSESLLRFMTEQMNLKWHFTDMRAKRVRATGAVVDEDFTHIE